MSDPARKANVGPQTLDGRGGPRSRSLRQSCAGRREPASQPGSRRTRALAVELEITWIEGEAAHALRIAQARVMRKMLTTIAARRARTTHTPDVPEDNK